MSDEIDDAIFEEIKRELDALNHTSPSERPPMYDLVRFMAMSEVQAHQHRRQQSLISTEITKKLDSVLEKQDYTNGSITSLKEFRTATLKWQQEFAESTLMLAESDKRISSALESVKSDCEHCMLARDPKAATDITQMIKDYRRGKYIIIGFTAGLAFLWVVQKAVTLLKNIDLL